MLRRGAFLQPLLLLAAETACGELDEPTAQSARPLRLFWLAEKGQAQLVIHPIRTVVCIVGIVGGWLMLLAVINCGWADVVGGYQFCMSK